MVCCLDFTVATIYLSGLHALNEENADSAFEFLSMGLNYHKKKNDRFLLNLTHPFKQASLYLHVASLSQHAARHWRWLCGDVASIAD